MVKHRYFLKKYSREHRKNMTLGEKLLWVAIRQDVLGCRVLRQKIIGKYIADFYIAKYKLIIEVDGDSHNYREQSDQERQERLESWGYTVIRFWDYEIQNDLEFVLEKIVLAVIDLSKKSTPTPPFKKGGAI
jgi:very-short-patch-repair endonuclease